MLDNTKNPTYPADVPHQYDDKYLLSEFLCNTALAAQLNCLEQLGLDGKKLKQLKDWSASRSVTLRVKAEEKCVFLRETTREEEDPTKYVREYTGVFGGGKREDKIVRTIHEWFWKFSVHYEIFAFQGNNPEEKVVFQSRSADCELMTSSKNNPYNSSVVRDSIDLNLTWMLQRIALPDMKVRFAIDRTVKSCHTPRRNADVSAALRFMTEVTAWTNSVHRYFTELCSKQQNNAFDMGSINIKTLFNPVVPLFEPREAVPPAEQTSCDALVPVATVGVSKALLSIGEVNSFLEEQKRSMTNKCTELAAIFPRDEKIVTMAEAAIMLTVLHAKSISQYYSDGVDYIEDMLRKQLIAAIGKEVTPVDFANYMTFHNRKLFRDEFQPQPFSYAIRRPDHYPEGVLSVEAQLADGSISEPISTIVSRTEANTPLKFSIHAAATVSFTGEAYLHAFVGHQFSGQTATQLSLNARARQFSSFLVLIGRISGPGQFDPKYGMIVQNKDDITIPLNLETIPTPKEFGDAIASLSPEQQRFARAFRSMQLASTLFAVCVIQIKPQLEKLLKLPYDSLTKEIQMTQDLLEMFIKYQIPSDLISYAGPADRSDPAKVGEVKGHLKNMQDMIALSKDKELKDAADKATYQALDAVATGSAVRVKTVVDASNGDGGGRRGGGKFQQMVTRSGGQPAAKPAADGQPAVAGTAGASAVIDYTKVPVELDQKFQRLDEDSALRPTIINAGKVWSKRSKKGLLSDFVNSTVEKQGQKLEKQRCYDLLDALTKSGCLSIEGATLHVIMTATHCFDQNIMNTLVQDNINPIEKVERSNLIVATTIHGRSAEELVKPEQLERVRTYSPGLFIGGGGGAGAGGAIENNNNAK